MTPLSDPTVRALTGQLASILLLAVPLAAVISLTLLRIYLAAVRRSMRRRGSVDWNRATESREPALGSRAPTQSLSLVETRLEDPLPPGAAQCLRRIAAGQWRAVLSYAVGGIAFALLMAAVYLTANGLEALPFRFLLLTVIHGWPLVLALGLVLPATWRGWLGLIGGYATLLAAAAYPVLNQEFTPATAAYLWALVNLAPTTLAAGFLVRRIRAVGPLVLALVLFAVGGSLAIFDAVGTDDANIRRLAAFGLSLGLDGQQTFFATALVGALVLGAVGWLVLRGLGHLYRAGAVSDQSIGVNAMWLLFAIVYGIDLAFRGPRWFWAAIGAFAVYLVTTLAMFAATRPGPDSEGQPPSVLLLRVFSLGRRSQALFHAFSSQWRHAGALRLIAGPDLATTTVEPHEFLEFLTGRLSRRFISDPATLEQRLAETATRRDRDGRLRVADLFCHDDTWQMVLRRLARESDAALMDLRGFGPDNRGCVFEILELLALMDLRRCVFVIDRTTDLPFLRSVFLEGWSLLPATSPNFALREPSVTLLRLERPGHFPRLVAAMARAARP